MADLFGGGHGGELMEALQPFYKSASTSASNPAFASSNDAFASAPNDPFSSSSYYNPHASLFPSHSTTSYPDIYPGSMTYPSSFGSDLQQPENYQSQFHYQNTITYTHQDNNTCMLNFPALRYQTGSSPSDTGEYGPIQAAVDAKLEAILAEPKNQPGKTERTSRKRAKAAASSAEQPSAPQQHSGSGESDGSGSPTSDVMVQEMCQEPEMPWNENFMLGKCPSYEIDWASILS